MKTTKKILGLVALMLVMVLTLTACGGTDLSKLTDAYNTAANEYNALAEYLTELGLDVSEGVVTGMNQIADTITTYKTYAEGTTSMTQEQADAATAELEKVPGVVAQIKAEIETLLSE